MISVGFKDTLIDMTQKTAKTCFELRAALDKLYLRQSRLAELCGVDRKQVWRWCDGRAPVPAYAWTIVALLSGHDKWAVMRGDLPSWEVRKSDVYRNADFKQLAKRFHPDTSGRDTTAEMQLINKFRR